MANKRKKAILPKYNENHPTVLAIRRYEEELAVLEKKRDKANDEGDWQMRNWYTNQIRAKETNMEILKQKLGAHRISMGVDCE